MNYQNTHDNIIAYARLQNRSKLTDYFENHHIVLKSMGGSNKKENLVLLTAKEHYVVHHLLWKIHKNTSTALALLNMQCNKDKKRISAKINSKEYEKLRIIARKNSVIQGKIAGLKAVKSGQIFISGSISGKLVSKETGSKLGKTYGAITGKITGVVNCKALGLKAKGSFYINNEVCNKRLPEGSVLPEGWKRGRITK